MIKKYLYISLGLLLIFCQGQAFANDNGQRNRGFFTPTEDLECYNQGTIIEGKGSGRVSLPGGRYKTNSSDRIPSALLLPDATGDEFLQIPIPNDLDPSRAYLDAHEVRLKVREVASQLLETWQASGLADKIAYITTFTPQHDLMMPTPFGQYLREALMYEFNNRGFPVRDFSARSIILNRDGFAFGVSNNDYNIAINNSNAVLVTGTFYADNSHLFLNIRLVRGLDGMVLRSAQTVFTLNPLLSRMVGHDYRPPPPPKPILSAGELPIIQGRRGN